jgi:hypothetical protein
MSCDERAAMDACGARLHIVDAVWANAGAVNARSVAMQIVVERMKPSCDRLIVGA